MKKLALLLVLFLVLVGCKNQVKSTRDKTSERLTETKQAKYPSDVIPFMADWKLFLGDGTHINDVVTYKKNDFFYVERENTTDWVVYKTPNSGITTRSSTNTRTELGQKQYWTPEQGGKLTGTLKVQHVSVTGDARVAAAFSVVVGQIHSDSGHENEPLKIFYKKFPGHAKGSVFWNYEINTKGDNSKRWDNSTVVWGLPFSNVGMEPNTYPQESEDGIALGEVFSYEVNVIGGIMHLTFTSEGHQTKTFTKNLLASDFIMTSDMPLHMQSLNASINRDGVESENAYAGELQYFKQGAYNQANGKDPKNNWVWNTGSEMYDGDIAKQYANGSYAEVWFKAATLNYNSQSN